MKSKIIKKSLVKYTTDLYRLTPVKRHWLNLNKDIYDIEWMVDDGIHVLKKAFPNVKDQFNHTFDIHEGMRYS